MIPRRWTLSATRHPLCVCQYSTSLTNDATLAPSAGGELCQRDWMISPREPGTARQTEDSLQQTPFRPPPAKPVTSCGGICSVNSVSEYPPEPRNPVPTLGVFLLAEEAGMKDAKTYEEYAADCTRMAKLMSGKDRETLLKMADARKERAREADRQEKKTAP
jgi:hypothetical protein